MPLESLGDPDKINVKHLAVEDPEKNGEVFFDPERDISPAIWEDALSNLDEDRERAVRFPRYWIEFAEVAMFFYLTYPEKFAELEISDTDRDSMYDYFISLQNQENEKFRAFRGVAALKVLSPERVQLVDLDLFLEMAKKTLEKPMFLIHPKTIVEAKILFPGEFSKLTLTEDHYHSMVKNFKEAKKDREENVGGYIGYTLKDAMYIRLLFPSKEISALLSKSELEEAKRALETLGPSDPYFSEIATFAFALKVITAEKAYISDDGTIVVSNEKANGGYRKEIPPPPETRDF